MVQRDSKGRFVMGTSTWNKGMKRSDWISEDVEDLRREKISGTLKRKYESGERKSATVGNTFRRVPIGTRVVKGDYVWVKAKDPDVWIHEHRYVWLRESDWGFIPKGFVVHHINGDKHDNKIGNLMCLPDSIHKSIHMKINNRKRGVITNE